MLSIQPKILKGKFIQLEPLHETHKGELYNITQNGAILTYHGSKALAQDFDPWFKKAILLLSSQQHFPFVVRRIGDHKIVGSTRFYDISHEHHRLAIGYTWFMPEVWGSNVNPESKLLLLTFAFEKCLINRVEFMI